MACPWELEGQLALLEDPFCLRILIPESRCSITLLVCKDGRGRIVGFGGPLFG